MKIDLIHTQTAEALGDLMTGASKRLTSAAWDAKMACERITHHDADALEEIRLARLHLERAERHARAAAAYRRESEPSAHG